MVYSQICKQARAFAQECDIHPVYCVPDAIFTVCGTDIILYHVHHPVVPVLHILHQYQKLQIVLVALTVCIALRVRYQLPIFPGVQHLRQTGLPLRVILHQRHFLSLEQCSQVSHALRSRPDAHYQAFHQRLERRKSRSTYDRRCQSIRLTLQAAAFEYRKIVHALADHKYPRKALRQVVLVTAPAIGYIFQLILQAAILIIRKISEKLRRILANQDPIEQTSVHSRRDLIPALSRLRTGQLRGYQCMCGYSASLRYHQLQKVARQYILRALQKSLFLLVSQTAGAIWSYNPI